MSAEKNAGLVVAAATKIPTSPNIRERWGTQNRFHRCCGVFQAGTIAGGVSWAGWAEGSCLAVGQIAAKDGIACASECVGQCAEERGLGVASGAVGEDQSIAVGSFGGVEESAYRGIDGNVSELADGGVGQANILNWTAILSGIAHRLLTIP